MKKIWLIGLIILTVGLWSSLCFAEFKPGSEPDGFRGIKWGTDVKTLPGMKHLKTYKRVMWRAPSSMGAKIEVYTRKGDRLIIGRAKLEKIEYSFWKEEFYMVKVYTAKSDSDSEYSESGEDLREAVFEKFGKGEKDSLGGSSWSGDKIEMDFRSFSGGTGCLQMSYKKISKQIEDYEEQKIKKWEFYKKQKAKEGAKKGF